MHALQTLGMDRLSIYAKRPTAFLLRYVRRRPWTHAAIVAAVVGAVGCSVSTQYGVKYLVDTLSAGPSGNTIWFAFGFLVLLIAADNLLWRLAGWVSSHAFVSVTGDLRSELFRHLTGHSPGYFTHRLPGTLTGRVTATSNAAFAIENLFIMECTAALPGDGGRHRLLGQPSACRWRPSCWRSPPWSCWCCSGWRLAARRSITASPTGRAGGGRAGRRHRQHAAGADLRRHRPRAQPLRPHGRAAR